jgi:hypothetical protein
MKNCAYERVCKGICSKPNSLVPNGSCIKEKKSEEEYWKEIQEAMIALERLERIRHYLSTKPKIIRTDIIEQWATLKKE